MNLIAPVALIRIFSVAIGEPPPPSDVLNTSSPSGTDEPALLSQTIDETVLVAPVEESFVKNSKLPTVPLPKGSVVFVILITGAVPATSRLAPGLVVPIPTLTPELVP